MGLSWDALIFNMDFESIVVLVHSWIQLGGIGFAPSNEDLAFRAGICHLLNLFLRTMFKLRQGRSPIFGTFFLWCCSENLFEKAQILEPFWFLFLGRELGQVSTFWWWLDYLAAQVGPGKRILWLNADETSLSRVGAKKAVGHIVSKRWWPTRLGPKRPCQKDQRRASVTHIACMCSETSVQPHLPQTLYACSGHTGWAPADTDMAAGHRMEHNFYNVAMAWFAGKSSVAVYWIPADSFAWHGSMSLEPGHCWEGVLLRLLFGLRTGSFNEFGAAGRCGDVCRVQGQPCEAVVAKWKLGGRSLLGSVDRMPRQSLPSIPLWKEVEKSFWTDWHYSRRNLDSGACSNRCATTLCLTFTLPRFWQCSIFVS